MTDVLGESVLATARLRRWPTLGVAASLAAAARALSSTGPSVGVIIMGDAGIGKTAFARALLNASDAAVRWTAGSATARAIPMGAFAHLLDIVDTTNPTAVLRRARAELLRQSTSPGAPPLLAIDDAHLLDPLSATLLHHLVMSRSARFVVAARTGVPVPDAVTALWKDGLLTRIDLEPLTRNEVARVVESALGGSVEQFSIDQFHHTSQGNPLYLRHLVEGAVAADNCRQVAGVWQLRGPMAINRELSALVGARIDQLEAGPLRVAELVAFGEPLETRILGALTSEDDIEAAERLGVITLCGSGSGFTARLAHPIYGAVIRDRAPLLAVRRRRSELYRALSSRTDGQVSSRLQVASLALGSDSNPGPDLLIAAGRDALGLGDIHLAERLLRRAYEVGGGLLAVSLLSFTLSWQGKGLEVEELLGAIDTSALTEVELLLWGVPQAVNYFWVLKDPQCAYQVLTALRKQFGTQAALECVDGLDSTFSVYLGHPGAGLVLANRVLNSPAAPASAVAWATAGAALASAQLGRFNDLRVYVERGLDAVQFAENGVLRNLLGYAQVIALPLQGAAVEAVRVAERLTQSAHLQQPGAAVGDAVLGKALMSSGAVAEAVERLWQAVAALERNGLSSWEFLAATTLCEAFSVLGRVPEAEETLERVERCFGPDLAGFEGEWILARAWLMAARGDLREARMLALEAADAAAAASFRATECQALIASVRFGDHTVDRRLARLASAAPEILVLRIAVDHAAALARHDGNALEEVELRYERAGLRAVAADAFAHAAAAYNVLGVRNRCGATMAHAAKLASDCGGLRTIGLADMTNPLPLTIREREIANLLAQGLTNKQIAERLVVSVRTVEGHIYRACTKINVADREALAEAFVGHQQLR